MRLSPVAQLALLAALGTLSSGKPLLEPCPSACRCFLSEGLKRADCKHVPEWADQQSDAQDVRIVPPRPSAAGRPGALHLTHFEVFPKVLQLAATNRSLVEIIPSGFHGLHSLQALDLSHNLLSRFNFKVFLRMPALQRLVLQDNPIVLEPNSRLLSSRSLQSLDLSHCNIARIPPGSLDGMPKLTSLSLRGNPIQIGGGEPLLPISTIQELDLSACGLQSVPPKALENLQNLRKLYLDGNKLLTISKGVLPRGLHLLDLSVNQIHEVPTAVITSLKNLTRLELSENPIKCTCSLLGMQGWMSRQLVVSEKPVICAEPAKFKGLPWMKVNELELCQDEESSSSSYSQSDSSDESSVSETQESEDSSQPLSIEIPPASYEVYTHENVIKHPQPALSLDHVLELKTLDFRSNNEINSIQGDQPYTHDVTGTEQDTPEEETSSDSLSKESLEDESSPAKRSGEHSGLTEERSEQEIGIGFIPDDEDATEKDAEVFMRNADTIAMGKSMPGEAPKVLEGDENIDSPDTSTPNNVDETEATQQPESHSAEGQNVDDGNDATSAAKLSESEADKEAHTESDILESSEGKVPMKAEDETTADSVFGDEKHETETHSEDSTSSSIEIEGEGGNHMVIDPVEVSQTSQKVENKDDFATEAPILYTTPGTEHGDVLQSTISDQNIGGMLEGKDITDESNQEEDTDNQEEAVTQSSKKPSTEQATHTIAPDLETPGRSDDVREPALTLPPPEEKLPTEDVEHSVSTQVVPVDVVGAFDPAGADDKEKESDRSEHSRTLDHFGDSDATETGGENDIVATSPSVEVPVVEEEIRPRVTHVLETNEGEDTEQAVEKSETSNAETEGVIEHAVTTEENIVESLPVDNEITDNDSQRTLSAGRKHSEDLAADNGDSIPAEEEQKSTVTFIVLGCIVVAIVILIVFALVRGKSKKKDTKAPVREDAGTEMKDMMNPLLEPNGDHPEPRRGLLGSLELIREVEEGKSTSGEIDAPEAASLLKPGGGENEADVPEVPTNVPGAKGATANGTVTEAVVEPQPVQKEANGGPVVNGQAGKHKGIATVPSKVKVKAGVINTPVPRTPVLVNRPGNGLVNGTRDHL